MDYEKTITKLSKKITKHYKEWLGNTTIVAMFRDDPVQVYQDYLTGKNKALRIASRTEKLSTLHLNQFFYEALSKERYPLENFALGAKYACAVVQFEAAHARFDNNSQLTIINSVFYLSLTIVAGWQGATHAVGRQLLQGLDTPLLDLRHNVRHRAGSVYRHFWFLLQLYADFAGEKLDTSLYSYPADMAPYAAVLADWRSTDLDQVQHWVSAMADFHLKEARDFQHDEIAEFDDEDTMLFPFEILAFLRLRRWAGLSNPEHFEHPLMQHPLAKLPLGEPLPEPETPLLDQVIIKFRQDYPGSFA